MAQATDRKTSVLAALVFGGTILSSIALRLWRGPSLGAVVFFALGVLFWLPLYHRPGPFHLVWGLGALTGAVINGINLVNSPMSGFGLSIVIACSNGGMLSKYLPRPALLDRFWRAQAPAPETYSPHAE